MTHRIKHNHKIDAGCTPKCLEKPMSIKSFHNRNARRDKKRDKRRNGMRVDDAARKLAIMLQNRSELKSTPIQSMFHK